MNIRSGKFILRLSGALHDVLANEASKKSVSLNAYCAQILQNRFKPAASAIFFPEQKEILSKLKKKFGPQLLGVALFGSQIRGEATATSDTDLLIVLAPQTLLTRSLYSWWDEHVPDDQLSPHFVHLPESKPGGLWLEVALQGKIVWETGCKLTKVLSHLNQLIDSGILERHWAHGHPYWVWNDHEKQITHS